MSQENVEIVRRVFEADARRDSAAILDLYDPAVEWDYSKGPGGDLTGAKLYRGHDGLRAFFRDWSEAFQTFGFPCKELIDAGDEVISVNAAHGLGRTSGTNVEMEQWAVWSIRGGKVVRVVWFRTREEAFEAAGLSQ
jgi:ketosteroid isomerase-like protein